MSETYKEHVAAWKDCISGTALLYMGSNGEPDELTARALAAMDDDDVMEMEHVAALMIAQLGVRGADASVPQKLWGPLSRELHERFCPDCALRRIKP